MSLPQNTPSDKNAISPLNRANLQVISFTAMLGAWALLIAYSIGYFATNDARFTTLVTLEVIFATILTIAWLLQRRNKHNAATWTILLSTFAMGILFNFVVAGLGFTLGILLAVVFIMISWQTLPTRNATLAILMSVLTGILIVITDTNLAGEDRLISGFFLSAMMVVVGGIVIFILVINGLRGMEFKSINTQIRVAFLVTSVIPVIIIAIFQTIGMYNFFITNANNNIQSNANSFAREVNSLLFSLIINIEEDAARSEVINFLKNPNSSTAPLSTLASRYSGVISYGLLDTNGYLLLDNKGNSRADESKNAYFSNAAAAQITYVSDVTIESVSGLRVFYVSTPVLDEQGKLIGVIRIKFSAQILQTIAQDLQRIIRESSPEEQTSPIVYAALRIFSPEGEATETGINLVIVDEANIILAHSSLPELRASLLTNPGAKTLTDLQQSSRLPSAPTVLKLDDLAGKIQTAAPGQVFSSAIYPDDPDEDLVAVSSVQIKPWKVFAAQDAITFLTPIFNQVSTITIIILVMLAAIYFGASLTASLLVDPVNKLAAVARQLGEGNMETVINLPRKDELGMFAAVLENTRRQVYELLQTLEERVAERTAELTIANEKNERRARQLEAISQVAYAIARLRDPEELLPEITRQISASLGYYHAGIFLLDENREYAVLRAANSPGGQTMLARGHRLKVGRQGIVGNVTNTGRYRIALDVGEDAVFFNNPDLPETRSEAAIPLMIGETIIGALDVQSTEPNAFNEEDIKSLSLLGDQISIAIENARLFAETRQTLAQIQEIYAESSVSGWQSLVRESSTSGYRYVRGSIESLHRKIEPAIPSAGDTLEIPIVLRGEKLGDLKIRRPGQQTKWAESETKMYQAIAERMSFALENARLFSDARRRANLERVAAEAVTKISSSVRFETILRTAAEEISRLMDGSEVLIQIQPDVIDEIDNQQQGSL